jgi:hypothetical protein
MNNSKTGWNVNVSPKSTNKKSVSPINDRTSQKYNQNNNKNLPAFGGSSQRSTTPIKSGSNIR